MSKQTSKTLIGGFVVGAVVLAVIGILIFGSGRFFTQRNNWVLYFEESLKGLNVGSPVMFKGVKIGSVTGIKVLFNPEDLSVRMPVYIETFPTTWTVGEGEELAISVPGNERRRMIAQLIQRGMRAQLGTQSMVTGQLMVAIDFYPGTPVRLVGDDKVPEVPTIPSTKKELATALERLNLEELAANLNSTLAGIQRTVNSPEVMETVRNVNGAVKDVRKLVQNVDSQIEPLVTNINSTVGDYGKLARDVDREVNTDVDKTIEGIRVLVANLNGVVDKLDAAAEPLPETMAHVRRISRDLDELISSQRPNLQRTLENARATSQNVRDLSEQAKEDPSSVFFGGPPPRLKGRKK
ncbi:MAG: MCE family protein [Proteobacteria bacterium]|nr:MCE family protein [Pseudomonadota bacterium]NIS69126.1 MCE family protein [Pseudomonadota bacterium]